MKAIHHFALGTIVMLLVFWGAACESNAFKATPCDTLSVTSGKAKQISVSSHGKFHANFISIETADGKVLALKSKDGWQIVDCERALEVLIADLELARQTKQNP